MLVSNITIDQLNRALALTNNHYNDNIIWNREPEPIGKKLRFTIKVRDSKGPGAKISRMSEYWGKPARRTRYACWHAHGTLFDYILDVEPKAIIESAIQHEKIWRSADTGKIFNNWIDRSIESMVYPIMFSDSCLCNEID